MVGAPPDQELPQVVGGVGDQGAFLGRQVVGIVDLEGKDGRGLRADHDGSAFDERQQVLEVGDGHAPGRFGVSVQHLRNAAGPLRGYERLESMGPQHRQTGAGESRVVVAGVKVVEVGDQGRPRVTPARFAVASLLRCRGVG